MTGPMANQDSVSRRRAALNALGVIVLLIGLGSAGWVYGRGGAQLARRSDGSVSAVNGGDWQDETLSMDDSKSASRNLELYGGKLQVLLVRTLERLQRPESVAVLIVAGSAVVALGCFAVARGMGRAKEAG